MLLNFRDHENQLAESFSSETLAPLCASHGLALASLLPAPGQIAPEWNADGLINGFQALYAAITPQEVVLPGQLISKREVDLTDADRAAMRTQTVTHTTLNGEATVHFVSTVIEAAPAAPPGYDDLATLLAVLKRARNEGLALETVSL